MKEEEKTHLWACFNSPHCSKHLPFTQIIDTTYKYNNISININNMKQKKTKKLTQGPNNVSHVVWAHFGHSQPSNALPLAYPPRPGCWNDDGCWLLSGGGCCCCCGCGCSTLNDVALLMLMLQQSHVIKHDTKRKKTSIS